MDNRAITFKIKNKRNRKKLSELKNILNLNEYLILKNLSIKYSDMIEYEVFNGYIIIKNSQGSVMIFGSMCEENKIDVMVSLTDFVKKYRGEFLDDFMDQSFTIYTQNSFIKMFKDSCICNESVNYQRYIIYNNQSELQEKVDNAIRDFEEKNQGLKVILNKEQGILPEGFYVEDNEINAVKSFDDIRFSMNLRRGNFSEIKAVIYDENSQEYKYKIERIYGAFQDLNHIYIKNFQDLIISNRSVGTLSFIETDKSECSKGFGSLITAFSYLELYKNHKPIYYCADNDNISSIKIAEKFSTLNDLVFQDINYRLLNIASNKLKNKINMENFEFTDYEKTIFNEQNSSPQFHKSLF
jgi:hypothetical protein